MPSLFAASVSWLRRLPWTVSVALAWLALVSLYPVFLGDPSHPSASSAVLSQIHARERERDTQSDAQLSEMLSELAQLRERALKMQSSLEQALQTLPSKEDVQVTVEQRVVETIIIEPDLSLCPPPPQYVLDGETEERLQGIREHQQRVLTQCEEVHAWMHSVTSAPPREVHCESIDASRAEVLQQLAETHAALQEMREEASRLDTRLTDTQTHAQMAMQSLEERLRALFTATHAQATEQEENLRLLSVFREKFDRHAQAFAALLQSEREKARVLESINSNLANRPTPVCPPPPVVPAINVSEACPAQPTATVNETALYEHVERAVEEYVQGVLPQVESSLRETLRAELPPCAPSSAASSSVNSDDNQDEYASENPVKGKFDNDHKTLSLHALDHALLTTGTKVVKSATSPTFVPEDYRVGKKLQRMFSGTVIEQLIPDSDGQEVLDTLGVDYGVGDVYEPLRPDTDKGRCWAMKGTSGNYTVRLSTPIHIKSVTLFHLPWESSPNVGSALKNFVVHAAVDDTLNHWRALGGGEYNAYVGGYQHFSMDSETAVRFVRLEILDNHGKQDYTCLYRFSVHEDA